MFGDHIDDKFTNDLSSSAVASRGMGFWPVILVLMAAIGVFIYWAAVSDIEQVTNGEGRVIPSGQVQVVQALEAGIVGSIEVREGDIGFAGQRRAGVFVDLLSSRNPHC